MPRVHARATAIAWPMPPVAPVSSTVEPWICTTCEPIHHAYDRAVRAHRGRQDRRRGRARRAAARPRRGPGRRLGRCAAGLRRPARPSPASPRRPSRRRWNIACCRCLPVDATFSAGQYAELAHAEIDGLLAAGRRPIVVGGTGLYLRAALDRPRPAPAAAGGGARALERASSSVAGPPALHALLGERAPWAAASIDPNDGRRIVRALELSISGELEPPEGPSPALEPGAAPPDPARRA